jgi:hypothetical protein
MMIVALAVAVPIEVFAAIMLKYVPRIGMPRDPNPWLRVAGDATALIHAPWLVLSDFLCVKLCPPNFILQTITISGGYVDNVILVLAAAVLIRAWRSI